MGRTHEDIQDELLVLACQEHDDEALRALVTRWQPRLGRLAWRLTLDRQAASDMVQDSWVAIVRGLRRLQDPSRFRVWAYRIVRHKCADWIRRRTAQRRMMDRVRADDSADTGYSAPEPDDRDEVNRLRRAMGNLPPDERAILSLHYLDGMGIADIARVLNVPVGTVKSRLYYARNRLKQSLERIEQ